MRVMIVDDTRLARVELKTLLAEIPGIELIGEAVDVDEAAIAIEQERPDLVLLDIQMPGGTGFDVLERLERSPVVIFTTAYDEFALKAFEYNALDYLVKPIDPRRLREALARAGERIKREALAKPMLTGSDRVFLRDGERCWFVSLGEISHIVVDGNYAHVHFRGQRALLARSLSTLESRLDPALFFRANRNTLVNLQFIEAIEPWVNDGYRVSLQDGAELEVSRRQAKELRERLAL